MPDEKENRAESLRTLARSMRKALYECARCNRRFNVANAKENGIYKCMSCNIVMSPVSEQVAATLKAEDAELVLDESIPAEVQNALKNPENVHGKFVLLEKLGEGGMGAVFKAFDVELSRYVALKFIKSRQAAELRAEAKTLASLEHKNIARIYEVGTDFIAMQFVNGTTLGRGTVTVPLQMMIDVCEAVEWAHKRGIIHRDIKPDNIMVDDDGNVFVMDFGLAIKGNSDEIAGTPGYIAPELVGSIQGDVYSLGATLYTLLTGKRPMEFSEGEGIQTVIAKCRGGVTPPLPNDEPGSIIRKAMSKESKNRYQTANEMANDIRRYLRGEAVSAFSTSGTYRIRKLVKRKKVLFLTAAFAVLGIAIAGGIAFQNYKEKQSKEELARQEQENARKAKDELHMQIEENLNSLRAQAKIALDKILEARKKKEPGAIDTAYSTLKEILEYNFKKVIEKAPDLAEPYFIMGRIQRAIIQPDRAMEFQKSALKLDSKFAPALYEYAVLMAWEFDRKYDNARRKMVRQRTGQIVSMEAGANYSEPTKEDILIADGELRSIQAEIKTSIERIGTGFQENPLLSNAARDAASGIMDVYVGKSPDERKRGVERLKNALQRDKELEEVYSALLKFAGGYDEREKYALMGTATLPGYYPFCLSLGNMRNNHAVDNADQGKSPLGEYDKAESDYSEAIRLKPASCEAWIRRGMVRNNRGVCLADEGKEPFQEYQKADRDFSEAIRLMNAKGGGDASDYEVWMRRGQLRTNCGAYLESHGKDPTAEYDRADDDYSEGIKLCPTDYELWMCRGIVRTNRGAYLKNQGGDPMSEYERAEADYSEGIRLNPKSYELWMWRGLLRNNRAWYIGKQGKDPIGEYNRAEEDYSEGLRLNSRNSETWVMRGDVRTNRGWYLMNRGKDPMDDYKKAESDYDQAIALVPSSHSYQWRGSVKFNRGLYLERQAGLTASSSEQSSLRVRAAEAFSKTVADWQNAMELNPSLKSELDPLLLTARTKANELRKESGRDY